MASYECRHGFGGAELEPLLAHTTLVDACWLLKFAEGEAMPERKGIVPPWQLVPAEAKLSLTTLRRTTMGLKLPVAVLSSFSQWCALRRSGVRGRSRASGVRRCGSWSRSRMRRWVGSRASWTSSRPTFTS